MILKMFSSFFRGIWLLFRHIFDHFEHLLDGFDPIFDCSRNNKPSFENNSRFRLKYFLPFFLSSSVVLDCIILIVKNDFKLKPLPELYHRIVLIFWPDYWDQGDIIFLGSYILLPCTFFYLTRSRFEHEKNFIFKQNPESSNSKLVHSDGKVFSLRLSTNLLRFREKFKYFAEVSLNIRNIYGSKYKI